MSFRTEEADFQNITEERKKMEKRTQRNGLIIRSIHLNNNFKIKCFLIIYILFLEYIL